MARIMPKEGYYVYENRLKGKEIEVIYTTGVAGKGGHMYYRVFEGEDSEWVTLTWTCVPGLKNLADNYTYYDTLPKGIPARKL